MSSQLVNSANSGKSQGGGRVGGRIIGRMKGRTSTGRRVKVSVTVDPALLEAVDLYVQRHEQLDRSKVMDAALTQWYSARQDEAMADQFAEPPNESTGEAASWRRTRRAAVARRLNRKPG